MKKFEYLLHKNRIYRYVIKYSKYKRVLGGDVLKEINQFYTFNEYMKNNKLSPNEEDYIEMIYRLYKEEKDIKISNLSRSLNIRPSSVSNMVKKLQHKGILRHEKYGSIILSNKGEEIGKQLLNRHNIIEEFLYLIGVRDQIHEETEKIEHTISVETLVKINRLINFLKNNKDVLESLNTYI
ncbi:MarR family transcriptional regulator [Paeniclostridium sordellii]|nr:MarR family transcriptional regulator [Paeniclostridium sordellii]MBX9181308.1 MarR family transcriptional regulator [Paeniclostridium sordellii]MRZ28553.1 MarR family transcriptional regulator [Paeniclostridium sordellii]MVO75000.1 MarR family transcriptional regulator [Paeniclostridium sordellii]RGX09973.1 MarR family transcriptional regulator [Paeniclostridium sordellii]